MGAKELQPQRLELPGYQTRRRLRSIPPTQHRQRRPLAPCRGEAASSNRQNLTTEANHDEDAVTIQNKSPFAVAANPDLDSALDKLGMPPCGAQVRSSADLPAPSARAS